LALELTAELKLKGALQHLPDILDNRQFPLATQLRCAVALATLGDRRGAELIRKAALEKTEEQYYAIKNLPIVIGDGAAPVLCDAVRRYENRCTFPACQAMFSVSSEAAVPELLKLLDAKGSVASRKFAAECLFYKGPAARAAVPRLIKLLQEDPEMDGSMSARELAAVALGAIGPDAKEALPVLIRLAEVHAKDEWSLVKNKQPKLLPDHFGGEKYSDDYFVDAICKIRRK
jgi:HEAT repeat protein